MRPVLFVLLAASLRRAAPPPPSAPPVYPLQLCGNVLSEETCEGFVSETAATCADEFVRENW